MSFSAVRDFQCAVCGAPRTSSDDAMFIECEHCGAVLDVAAARWLEPQQYVELMARTREAAAAYTAVQLDPHIAALWSEVDDACRGFGDATASADEIVATAQRTLAIAERAFTALKRSPETFSMYPASALHYARMTVRVSLTNMLATLDDPAAYDRVVDEVLGDGARVGDQCQRCGAPLGDDARMALRCAHCGAVVERRLDDPWLAARLGRVAVAIAALRPGDVDTYVAALTVLTSVSSYEKAGATRIAALLERGIPWLAADELHRAIALYRSILTTDAARAVLDEAVAMLPDRSDD